MKIHSRLDYLMRAIINIYIYIYTYILFQFLLVHTQLNDEGEFYYINKLI